MANYDILGNIAIVKFKDENSRAEKIKKAEEIMKQYKGVRTVLEKIDKVRGRLRTIKTKHIIGEKNLIAEYKENGCLFKFNVETCYFSPRLASERTEIAKKIKKKDRVLVMFAGVGPFSIVIAKIANPKKIVSIELGKDCCKYARKNVVMNKAWKIETMQGDVKKIIPDLLKKSKKERFEVIVMPRPNLKETFLEPAFKVSKKGTLILYYGFSSEEALEKMLEIIHEEAKKCKKKIKITNIKEAGDIAPYEHRYRVEILCL